MNRAFIDVTNELLAHLLHLRPGIVIAAIGVSPDNGEYRLHLRGDGLPEFTETQEGDRSCQIGNLADIQTAAAGEKSSTQNKLHATSDSPIEGPDSKWNLATVTNGPFAGETVSIMVEFADGVCICERGDDAGMVVIPIENLRCWQEVEKVEAPLPYLGTVTLTGWVHPTCNHKPLKQDDEPATKAT